MFKINKSNQLIIGTLLLLASHVSYSNTLTKDILTLTQNKSHLAEGKRLFDSACSACHKKDLSGAMGFNLKDGEWIHGSSPTEIFNNISNGFSKAGMPPFTAIYNSEQRKKITAYVLSKREGWNNLSYKIFEVPVGKKRSIDELHLLTPVKQGESNKNIADFAMPESKEFGVVFEGDFYTYKDKDTILYALQANPSLLMKLEIDGNEVTPEGDWSRAWPLKRGKLKLKLTLVTPTLPWPKWTRPNVSLFVTNPEKTIKYFAASTRAKSALKGTKVEVKAQSTALIQRKKIVDLPPYTITVGLPEKMNYGFNTRSCSINGVWAGDLLNIGPNIKGRGKDGSLILGEWAFKYPQQIQMQPKSNACKFIKYTRGATPDFHYSIGETTFKLRAQSTQKNSLTFTYTVIKNSKNNPLVKVKLPQNKNITISSNNGVITGNTLSVNIAKTPKFSVKLAVKGDK